MRPYDNCLEKDAGFLTDGDFAKTYINWSGGKDSAFALYLIQQQKKYRVDKLLTNVNAAYNRISMHGVRRELLEAQAISAGIPLTTVELPEQPDMLV